MAIKVYIGTPAGGGTGDMLKSVYDPQNINGDAFDRSNHTGTQTASTISDFDAEVSNNTNVSQNTNHRSLTNNPHSVTKSQVGLSNVENESQRTIRVFKTEETGGFTPDVGSDRAWYPCNFATDQDVTLDLTSVTENGEPIYFKQEGVGLVNFVAGGGVTLDLNASGSASTTGQGDVSAWVKNGSTYIQL